MHPYKSPPEVFAIMSHQDFARALKIFWDRQGRVFDFTDQELNELQGQYRQVQEIISFLHFNLPKVIREVDRRSEHARTLEAELRQAELEEQRQRAVMGDLPLTRAAQANTQANEVAE